MRTAKTLAALAVVASWAGAPPMAEAQGRNYAGRMSYAPGLRPCLINTGDRRRPDWLDFQLQTNMLRGRLYVRAWYRTQFLGDHPIGRGGRFAIRDSVGGSPGSRFEYVGVVDARGARGTWIMAGPRLQTCRGTFVAR